MADEQIQENTVAIKKKVLVIEDDQFLRELLVQKLESEGYDLVQAVDGERGIEHLKTEKQVNI